MGPGHRAFAWSVLAAGTGLLGASPALAQTVAPTRDELTREQIAPQAPRSTLNVVGEVERSPCPLANPEFADVRVRINDIQFNNLKGVTPEEMRATWADYAGTEQPVAVICEIRDRAATVLRDKGYLAAVQVPTQQIDMTSGAVRLEVLYARVTAIRARGQTSGAEAKLAGYLNRLTEDEIFNRFTAERYLLLARDLPGYNVQLTLKPAGTGPGEMVGEVTVLRLPYSVDFMVQNLAAEATGRWGGQLRAQAFGLTGMGDATSVSIYSTADFKEQQILQLAHTFRPGSQGLLVNGQFTYAWTEPEIEGGPDAIEARTLFATLGLAYPLVRSQAKNLSVGGGFDLVNQKVDLEPFGALSRDRIRVAWLRADYDAIDLASRRPRWRVGGTVELRRGLDILNASDECDGDCPAIDTPPSRVDGDPTGTVLRANATGELALGETMALVVSPRAQYGFDPLFAFEEFTAGNYTVGRGYDPAIITGDSGVGVSVELRGPRLPISRTQLQVQPYVFGDAAWVWNKNEFPDDHLKSAGGGVRALLADRLALDAVVAVPLERTGIENRKGDARLLLTLTTRLLPWR